tara:strand:- start:170 stop:379 length:210 start_codon:yes stop_codon:yes gene_type:complete
MKKNKPIILVDPFPRSMDLLFSKKNLEYLNKNFILKTAPMKMLQTLCNFFLIKIRPLLAAFFLKNLNFK